MSQGATSEPITRMTIVCAVGVVAQLAGLWWGLRLGWQEVNLVVGIVLLAIGTTVCAYGIERYVVAIGRRDRWAVAALLGPIGPLMVARLEPGDGTPPRAPATRLRSRLDVIVGWLLTLAVTGAIGWLAIQWLEGHEWSAEVAYHNMQHNERQAYLRLKAIAEAQERYRQKDWDGDGNKDYAKFHVHLWQSVDDDGNPIRVDLISRELGFASSKRFALDGYTFDSIHPPVLPPNAAGKPSPWRFPNVMKLDPKLAWGVVAMPALPRKSGLLQFVADSSGTIWAYGGAGRIAPSDTDDPTARGWHRVTSVEQLAEIQSQLSYPEAGSDGKQSAR